MKPIHPLLKYLLLLIAFSDFAHAFYDPGQGRWLSRDPIEENGGVNLYVFVENDGVDRTDYLGMATIIPSAGGNQHATTNLDFCCYDESGNTIEPVKDDFGVKCCPDLMKFVTITWRPARFTIPPDWGHMTITIPENPDGNLTGGGPAALGGTYGLYPTDFRTGHGLGAILPDNEFPDKSKCKACPETVVKSHERIERDIADPPSYHWNSEFPSKNCKTWILDVLDGCGGGDCGDTVWLMPVNPFNR
jgi:hypothetical protein